MKLAQIKFFGLIICALMMVQTVCFEKRAASFTADVMVDYFLSRTLLFRFEYLPDITVVVCLVLAFFPTKTRLSSDID